MKTIFLSVAILLFAFFFPKNSFSQIKFLLTTTDLPDYELMSQSIHQDKIVQQWREINKNHYLYLNYYQFKNEYEAIDWISDRSGSFAEPYYFGFPNGEISGNSSWTTLTTDPYNSIGAFLQKWNVGVQIFFSNVLAGSVNTSMLNVPGKLLTKISDSISSDFLLKDSELMKYQLSIADYGKVAKVAKDSLDCHGFSEYRIEDSKWILNDDSLVMGTRKQWSGKNSFFSIDIAKFSNSLDAQLATEQNATIKRCPFFLQEDEESIKKAIERWYWPIDVTMKYISIVGRMGSYAVHYYYFNEYGVDIQFFQQIIQATTSLGTGTNNIEHPEFAIYPNPTHETFTLDNHDRSITQCQLFNSSGQLLQTLPVQMGINNFNISHLGQGMYFLKLKSGKETLVKKIIKD